MQIRLPYRMRESEITSTSRTIYGIDIVVCTVFKITHDVITDQSQSFSK